MAPVDVLASWTGLTPDSLALVTALLLAYPVAAVYKSQFMPTGPYAPRADVFTRNLFVVASGLAVALWFMQTSPGDIKHSLLTIVGTWSVMKAVEVTGQPRVYAAAFAWLFNCGYLFYHYYLANLKTADYVIDWMTPQCVLCLRMIGFAMDYWDGEQPAKPSRKTDALIADEELALVNVPSLLETLGYAYFFGGFLVGPQFPFERYRRWITGDLFLVREEDVKAQAAYHASMPRNAVTGKAIHRDGTMLELPKLREKGTHYIPSSALYAIRCLVLGMGVLLSTQVLRTWFYSERTVDPEFATYSFGKRMLLFWICGKVALEKYIGIWKLGEGPSAIAGLGYEGSRFLNDEHHFKWSGLTNIFARLYELPWCLQDIITAFNVNTNNWCKLYIFKRFRWLGSKEASALITMTFLAFWHGWHPGYFLCFYLEFMDMEGERILRKRIGDGVFGYLKDRADPVSQNVLFPAWRFVCWAMTTFALYYAGVAFDLLTWGKIKTAWGNVNWVGHLFIVGVLVADKLLAVMKVRLPTEALAKKYKQQHHVEQVSDRTKPAKQPLEVEEKALDQLEHLLHDRHVANKEL